LGRMPLLSVALNDEFWFLYAAQNIGCIAMN